MASLDSPLAPTDAWRHWLGVVRRSNRFQQAKLATVSEEWAGGVTAMGDATVPFTTKAELVADQVACPPYGTNLSYDHGSYTRCHQTSGTTGLPMRWLDTPEDWARMVGDWAEVFRMAGVVSTDRVFFAFSFGPFLGFWLAFEAAQTMGALCFPGGGMSSTVRARVLSENACTVLCCTPTYALHLAEVICEQGLKMPPVRTIVVAGEPGGSLPSTRAAISRAWNGASVFDHHGLTETGPVTHEQPGRPGRLLVLPGRFIAEVIDPVTAMPKPTGGEGELVLTPLRRLGMPLFRYRTGDLVRMLNEDGRLVLDGGILGRVDDMVVIRGVNVYPSAIDDWVRRIPGIAEYRVTLDRRGALPELGLEVEAAGPVADELSRQLQENLALRIPVVAVAADTLPRFEFKARRWVVLR